MSSIVGCICIFSVTSYSSCHVVSYNLHEMNHDHYIKNIKIRGSPKRVDTKIDMLMIDVLSFDARIQEASIIICRTGLFETGGYALKYGFTAVEQ